MAGVIDQGLPQRALRNDVEILKEIALHGADFGGNIGQK